MRSHATIITPFNLIPPFPLSLSLIRPLYFLFLSTHDLTETNQSPLLYSSSSSSSSSYKCLSPSPLLSASFLALTQSQSNQLASLLFYLLQSNLMADLESVRKRPRDQSEEEEEVLLPALAATKRPCPTLSSSYNAILDFLDSDDENLPEDVSSLISSLQEELSETLPSPTGAGLAGEGARVELSSSDSAGEEVIRRLVEASDDELGIPAGLDAGEEEAEEEFVGEISNYDVFWELEEEAANYYMLQSELFMA